MEVYSKGTALTGTNILMVASKNGIPVVLVQELISSRRCNIGRECYRRILAFTDNSGKYNIPD